MKHTLQSPPRRLRYSSLHRPSPAQGQARWCGWLHLAADRWSQRSRVEPPPNRWRIAASLKTLKSAEEIQQERRKKKHVFSELFVPIRCNFSLLVTLDVSVCLICPMWFQCRCRLQSRVNYIYFVMLASLFFHFISNQSACACVCMCVCGLPYIYTDIIITTSYSLQPSRAPMAPGLLHVFAAHIISLTGKRLFPHFLVF